MVRLGPQPKHVLRERLLPWKKIIGNKCDETGKIFWKRHKYWKVSITLIYLISKMYVTSHSHLRLKMFYLVFPRLKQLVKSVDWMGFQGFSIIFRLKWWSFYFSKYKFRFDCSLQFLHNNGIAHRDLKPENILASNKRYGNITDTAELNIWP